MIRALAFAAALAMAPVVAQATEWDIDPVHTTVGFAVKHLVVATVHGTFDKVEGTASWTKPDFSDAVVNVTIDAKSVNTRNGSRDDDLRSANYLDVQKYPTITFKSRRVEKGADKGHLKLVGDLTIHGVTKEVALDVEGPTPEQKTPWGFSAVGAEAHTKISRKAYGLTFNKLLETGGAVVGDEVKIDLNIELHTKPAKK